MQDHDDNNSTTQNPQDHDLTQYSASSSTHDTPATTSTAGTAEKTTGQWTEQEINLFLNYVKENCILTTARDLNMKRSEFNKACVTNNTFLLFFFNMCLPYAFHFT
jgi:PKD repeat protein